MVNHHLHIDDQPSAVPHPERARIVSAARKQFLANGFRGVTMDELARGLGMSKKTLYNYFPAKTALVEAVLRDKFAGAEGALEEVARGSQSDVLVRLRGLLGAVRRQTEEIQPAFVRDLRREAPELFQMVEEFRRGLVLKHFSRVLEEGQASGRIRRDLPVPLMVEILISTTDAFVNPAKLEELGLAVAEAYGAVLTLFLDGALCREGEDA